LPGLNSADLTLLLLTAEMKSEYVAFLALLECGNSVWLAR
jgi:hypothetical protein